MWDTGMHIAEMEKRAALQVLVYLYKNERATITELRKHLKASLSTIYTALERLGRLNLIKQTKGESFPFSLYYELTPLGREVAELLARIEELLAKARGQEAG